MADEKLVKLAIKIREVQCKTDEYDREGAREVPLVDEFSSILEMVEDALGIKRDDLYRLGQVAGCGDEECALCGQEI
jgi:hypothetical protein